MTSLLPIIIRLKTPEDDALIHSSWITNMYSAKPHSYCAWNLFCTHQDKLIESIYTISTTLVACLAEDPETILGYLTYSTLNDQFIVHFCYVKQAFRGNHIMLDLIKVADPNYKHKLIAITQITKSFSSLYERYQITYDPYVIDLLLQLKETNENI